MANEQPKWKSINMGEILPCQSFLRKKDGEILKLSTIGGVTVGQDCYYLPVDEVINVIKDYPVEESKDERIRKAIYNCVKWFGFDSSFFEDVSQEECLAYLEKQGEKKHQYNSRPRYVGEGELLGKKATKIEPKFKVGDVIRQKGTAATYTIIKVTDTTYYTKGWSCSIERCEKDYELVEPKYAEIVKQKLKDGTYNELKDGELIQVKQRDLWSFKK